jgi:DNA (cytosine-5)-methyltransferase 1
VSRRKHDRHRLPVQRGVVVDPAPHPDAISSLQELEAVAGDRRADGHPLMADLFCGCGGLSLGAEAAGFVPVLGVDHDQFALRTWRSLFPGLAADLDLSHPEVVREVGAVLREIGVDMIVGGPPCQPFSRAARSLIRSLIMAGRREAYDERRDLWQSFLEIVEMAKPRIVLMENVPELALGGNAEILRTIVRRLEDAGYGVATRVVATSDHGVPQYRQRAIIIGLKGDDGPVGFQWPTKVTRTTLWDAIGDLPPIEPGWNRLGPDEADGYDFDDQPSELTNWFRNGLVGEEVSLIRDHVTRAVREDDLQIFRSMDCRTKYSEIDESLKRYRDDIFDDKYKRLDEDKPSRSITAHLAKDGYWYIHPRQDRTLSIREAARVQTFPDRVRFAGPPSASLRQIGNAVPPLAARSLVDAALDSLKAGLPATLSGDVSFSLSDHYEDASRAGALSPPWLAAGTSAWQVVQSELLAPRGADPLAGSVHLAVSRFEQPAMTVAEEHRLTELFGRSRLAGRLQRVLAAANWFENDGSTDFADPASIARNPFVPRPVADLAVLVAHDDDPVLATSGTLRVAARFSGRPVDVINRNSDGRLEIARMIGGSLDDPATARTALLGLIDLSTTRCVRGRPRCEECPLQDLCVTGSEIEHRVTLDRSDKACSERDVEDSPQPVELVTTE